MSWLNYSYTWLKSFGNPPSKYEIIFIPHDKKRYQEALVQKYFTEEAAKKDLEEFKLAHYNLLEKSEFRIYDREKQEMVNINLNTIRGEFIMRPVYY